MTAKNSARATVTRAAFLLTLFSAAATVGATRTQADASVATPQVSQTTTVATDGPCYWLKNQMVCPI